MRRLTVVFVFLLGGLSRAAAAPEIHCDGQEENLSRYLALFEVLFEQRDGSRAGEFYADEFISHNSDANGAGRVIGRPAQLERMFNASKDASPDRVLVNDLIICKDDMVSTRMTVSGTQTGEMMGAPATGRKFQFTAMDIFRFEDGKVVERWGNADHLVLIRQLGLDVDLSLQPISD
ncbi:MAG: ester cyclase [Rhodospirillaceae bacterium]